MYLLHSYYTVWSTNYKLINKYVQKRRRNCLYLNSGNLKNGYFYDNWLPLRECHQPNRRIYEHMITLF